MNTGSYDTKKRFCRSFIESHRPSTTVVWIPLEEENCARIQSIPFWTAVLRSQSQLTAAVSALASVQTDPLLKAAMTLQGEEQQQLTQTLQSFLSAYQIDLPTVSVPPLASPATAFIDAAYQRCLEVFVGYGLLEALRQTRFVPAEALQPLETILDEQIRHNVFFTNWLAYAKTTQTLRWPEGRIVPVLWRQGGSLLAFMVGFKQKDMDERPIPTQWMAHFTGDGFLNLCQTAYQQRLKEFPPEVLRPQLGPSLAKLVGDLLRVWPQRKASPTINTLSL